MIIAIDGPAGAGKSSIARELAKKLGIKYFDSGAVYRTLTYWVINVLGVSPNGNLTPFINKLNSANISVFWEEDGMMKVKLFSEDFSHLIRNSRVTANIKYIAENSEFREYVNNMIKETASSVSVVVDGRDIGTIVFPNADCKFYLDASLEVRASRRAKEIDIDIGSFEFVDLVTQISNRDEKDKTRKIAPLLMASDAVYVDTTNLSFNNVLKKLLRHIEVERK